MRKCYVAKALMLFVVIFVSLGCWAQVPLAGWDVSQETSFGTSPLPPSTVATNITVGPLTKGSGIMAGGTAAGRAWGGGSNSMWSTLSSTSIANNAFVTFTIKANAGYAVSLSSISTFDYRISAGGPTSLLIQYQLNNGAFNDVYTTSNLSTGQFGGSLPSIDLSGIAALQNVPATTTINFRIVPFGASGGTWYIFDRLGTQANDFVISGTVNPPPTITSFTPSSGYNGSSVVITGTNFTGATAVLFGGTPAKSFVVNSATQITAVVNTGASGPISITTPAGSGNSGSNFVFDPTYISSQNGNWNNAATWLAGVVPATSENVIINHTVTIANAVTRAAGTNTQVNAGGILNVSATYTNNGNTTVNGILQMNGSGVINSNAPVYGNSSTLIYNASTYGRNNEWTPGVTSGPGFPNNVQIGNTVNTVLHLNNSNPLQMNGNLIILSGSSLILNETVSPKALIVAKDVQVSGTLTLGNVAGPDAGDLFIGGNLINTGNFNHNGRSVTFNGNNIQAVTGNTAFSTVRISNNNSVTLSGSTSSVNVLSQVDLTGGSIVLGTNNLTLSSGASVANAGTSRFIVTNSTGQLLRPVANTQVIFPVGNTTYNPLRITNSGTPDTYGVRVANGVPPPLPFDQTKLINRYWIVTEATSGGSNLSITGQYNAGEENANFTSASNPKIGYYTTDWVSVSAVSANTIPNTFTSTSSINLTSSNLINGAYFGLGKDDAFVTAVCNAPGALSVTSITSAGANLTWSGTGSSYEFAVTTSATPPLSGLITSNTNEAVTGLASSSTYYLHTRTVCGLNYNSAWATSEPFTTSIAPVGLITWLPTGQNVYGTSSWAPTTVDPRLIVTNMVRGAGVGSIEPPIAANNAWGGYNWAGSSNQDINFTLEAKPGYKVSLSNLVLFYRKSTTGPVTGLLQYAIGGGPFINITTWNFTVTTISGARLPAVNLSAIAALQDVANGTVVRFRILPQGGAAQGTFYIFNEGLVIGGTLISTVPPPVAASATPVNTNCFTANWGAVAGASGYFLDVYASGFSIDPTVTTLAGWDFVASLNANSGIAANSGVAVLTAVGTDPPTITQESARAVSWQDGAGTKYWETHVSTLGYYNIKVSSRQRSSPAAGPRDFKLQYKIGAGGVYIDVAGASITVANDYNTGILNNVTLPPASENVSSLYLRWIMVSNTSVNGTTVTNLGASNIDDIKISGNAGVNTSFVAGYQNRAVGNSTSVQVTGLNPLSSYNYVVRSVVDGVTSANSNIITATTIDENNADFRSRQSGNYSDKNTWEYDPGCSNSWIPATVAPGSFNNVYIQPTHSVVLDVSPVISASKTIQVAGELKTGTNVISGNGSFTLVSTSTATLAIGSAAGISVTGNTGSIQVAGSRNFGIANYVYNGTNAQVTGNGLPASILALTINNSGVSPNNKITLTRSGTTLLTSTTYPSLLLSSGLLQVPAGSDISIAANAGVRATAGNFDASTAANSGTITFLGAASVIGAVDFYPGVILAPAETAGVGFGTQSVIHNYLRLQQFSVVTTAPLYSSSSTLIYNAGGAYNRAFEWGSGANGTGLPNNVLVTNSTIVNAGGLNGTHVNSPLNVAGDLSIDAGAQLLMNAANANMNVPLKVAGNITIHGILTASGTTAGNIEIGKHWSNTGTFQPNNRLITFNGQSDQVVTNLMGETFDFVTVNKISGNVVLANDLTINKTLTLTQGKLVIGSTLLSLNGPFLGSVANSFSGSKKSNLLLGTGFSGTLFFDQSPGTENNFLNSITLNADVTLGNRLNIAPSLITSSFTTGFVRVNGNLAKLHTSGFLHLISDRSGTARIARRSTAGNNNKYIIGDVTVQRFITGKRAWRLLTSPITTTGLSINAAWQEGQVFREGVNYKTGTNNPVPPPVGFGTHITGGTATYPTAELANPKGFDHGIIGGTNSIWKFNSNTSKLETLGPLGTVGNFLAGQSYFLFVRGDRNTNILQGASADTSSTILRPVGEVGQGDQTGKILLPNQFNLINNPFPSPINFSQVNADNNGLGNKFWIWNSRLGRYGGYALSQLQENGGGYIVVPKKFSYDTDAWETGETGQIQSGQAFFVKPATSLNNFIIKEAHKSDSTNNNVFNLRSAHMYANLYDAGDSSVNLTDGVLAIFNDNQQDGNTGENIHKLPNLYENFSLRRNEQNLMVEVRPSVQETDTLFLDLSGTTFRKYQFKFKGEYFSGNSVSAYLEDEYLHISTPIDLNGRETTVNFSISFDSLSNKNDRFRVVFKQNDVLAVDFVNVKAYPHGRTIQIDWSVENEKSIEQYIVEKSEDGLHFKEMQSVKGSNNPGNVSFYKAHDMSPDSGNNYYRIKSIANSGAIKYSHVVRVTWDGMEDGKIGVYPNPLTGNNIHVHLINIKRGRYSIMLYNQMGQMIFNEPINHRSGNAVHRIHFSKSLPGGLYELKLAGKGTLKVLHVTVQ